MKKLVNQPGDFVDEMLKGMIAAHPDTVRRLDGTEVVVRTDAPADQKVAVVSGGGSGHEPMHAGYVGKGMLDGAAAGEVFTSPPATEIRDMLEAVDSGAGVLAVIKNYEGDLMNFDTAADLADVEYADVVIDDDVAVSEAEDRTGRRGVAGTVFVHKIAGAMADRGASLDEVQRVAQKTVDNIASMGVALSSCTTPEKGEPTFDLPEDEIEFGIGIHGEPGIERTEYRDADEITERLTAYIADDLDIESEETVVAMVNGLGGTPLGELYIVTAKLHDILADRGVDVVDTWVEEYCTSLDMEGCSITILRVDDELRDLLDHPASTPGLTVADEEDTDSK